MTRTSAKRDVFLVILFTFLFVGLRVAHSQTVGKFPTADVMLQDAKHKEPKSGVRFGPGNTLTIQQGVGAPTVINALAFSQDARFLAAGKDFGRVVVWDVENRKFLCAIDTGQGIVDAVALSRDGQLLLTGGQGDNFRLKLWHLPDGKLIRSYDYFGGYVHSAVFSSDTTWAVVGDNNATTHVIDVLSGKQILELKDTYAPILSPDGDLLVTINKQEFTFWNTKDWTKLKTLPRAPQYAIPLSINPTKEALLVTASGGFHVLRLNSGQVIPSPELPEFNAAAGGFASFDAKSSLIFGHSDDRLWAWNTATNQTCVSDLMYSESGTLSADGKLLAGAKDNSVVAQTRSGEGVWIWETGKLAQSCFATK